MRTNSRAAELQEDRAHGFLVLLTPTLYQLFLSLPVTRVSSHLSRPSGVTVAESEDPEALDKHLRLLEAQRAALLDRRSHCVSVEVQAELDARLQSAERHREQLNADHARLKGL